jgi:hypothetical protein
MGLFICILKSIQYSIKLVKIISGHDYISNADYTLLTCERCGKISKGWWRK